MGPKSQLRSLSQFDESIVHVSFRGRRLVMLNRMLAHEPLIGRLAHLERDCPNNRFIHAIARVLVKVRRRLQPKSRRKFLRSVRMGCFFTSDAIRLRSILAHSLWLCGRRPGFRADGRSLRSFPVDDLPSFQTVYNNSHCLHIQVTHVGPYTPSDPNP